MSDHHDGNGWQGEAMDEGAAARGQGCLMLVMALCFAVVVIAGWVGAL